jgi:hypothetical protein
MDAGGGAQVLDAKPGELLIPAGHPTEGMRDITFSINAQFG